MSNNKSDYDKDRDHFYREKEEDLRIWRSVRFHEIEKIKTHYINNLQLLIFAGGKNNYNLSQLLENYIVDFKFLITQIRFPMHSQNEQKRLIKNLNSLEKFINRGD